MAQESEILQKIPALMRSARKRADFSQVFVAKRLGLSQGGISKLEKGAMVPSAPMWFAFCELTGISPDSLTLGYLERHDPITLDSSLSVGGFKIPNRYRMHRGSKVRAMKPFLNFFAERFSKKKLDEYLKEKAGVDPDYFVDLDAQLNLNFNLDMMDTLVSSGQLKSKDLVLLAMGSINPQTHGAVQRQYDSAGSAIHTLSTLVQNAHHYESNFKYAVEAETLNRLELSVSPESHLREFRYRDHANIGDALCRYKKHYFQEFLRHHAHQDVESVVEHECHYRGAKKCLYEFKVAG